VIPLENCHEDDGRLAVSPLAKHTRDHIRRSGSEVARGALLAKGGEILETDLLALLRRLGIGDLTVSARPRTAIYCTGSELIAPGTAAGRGQKFSSNGWVVADRVSRFGAEIVRVETLQDTMDSLDTVFSDGFLKAVDLVITTGGMGPGKFDLVRKAFSAAGGSVVLDTLPMQPGKVVLVGLVKKTVVLCLPGPPHAVRVLADLLVGPIVHLMQGAQGWPAEIEAFLMEELRPGGDLLQLKAGKIEFADGRLNVRLAGILESIDCFILVPPGKNLISRGSLVKLYRLHH
jgi:molybdopterin molybdotransferase